LDFANYEISTRFGGIFVREIYDDGAEFQRQMRCVAMLKARRLLVGCPDGKDCGCWGVICF
jgi:hypothetical protein